MTGEGQAQLGLVRVEVLGRSDHMQPEQVLAVEELSDFLLAERVDSDVYFREPGGMGLPPLETIAIFTGTSIAGGMLYDLAKAVLKAAVAWGRERIRRQPPDGEPPQGRPVRVTLYGPKGEMLKILEVTREGVDHQFTHPSIEG